MAVSKESAQKHGTLRTNSFETAVSDDITLRLSLLQQSDLLDLPFLRDLV